MNKIVKYILIGLLVLGALWAAVFFIKSNSKSSITYETQKPFISNIEKKTVATGKVVPEDEIEIKPQISGIIEKIYLEEGVKVKAGDLIAVIKVVPNEQSLNQAKGRVTNAQIALSNTKIEYDRNKSLFDKGVISSQDFNNLQLRFDQADQELKNARADYQIIRVGSAGGSSSANTNIRATVEGTILEIPVEEGDQVIQSNNFNDGTTIATIADLGKMIFEGKVDEGEVGKLTVGTPLKISLGAVEGKELDAKLRFIAPKGVEETGAVQFKIEGDVEITSRLGEIGIKLPEGMNVKSVKGELFLYRQDDKQKDTRFTFEGNKTEFPFVSERIVKGRWKAKLSWAAEGKDYYHEENIWIK